MRTLDAYMPTFEFVERHRVRVAGDRAHADAALRAVTFGDLPLMRVLLFVRGLGLGRRNERVLEAMRKRSTVLEDVPGEGMVLAISGTFWRWRGTGCEPPATAVVDFRAIDGVLTTETRVHVADAASRRRFARYWLVVRPFSGLTRIALLRAARRRLERA
jgi:membrane protein implicated in regulation of membrane protease activity